MTCEMCRKRGKDWDGDDPRCAFENGAFDGNNWNCATANAIRAICYEGRELPDGVSYEYCDDWKYATIRLPDDLRGDVSALCLWVSWYKSRGRTEAMWLLDCDDAPRLPTEQECVAIIKACEAQP